MNRDFNDTDPQSDPLLLTAGEPPVEEVDWVALRRSIQQRAELPLRRRRARASRLRWARTLVPLAVAAGVGAVTLLGRQGPGEALPESSLVASVARAVPTTEDALRAAVSDQEFRLLVTGGSNPDALLLIAANRE